MPVATVIIQARMGSTRLPGKSLARLGSSTVLEWTVRRAGMAKNVSQVLVATSRLNEDDAIAEACSTLGVECVRGSADDVLARFGDALELARSDLVVRITADCPLIDPGIVEQAVALLESNPTIDYASTSFDGRFPRGFDVEAMRRSALETALKSATNPEEREHVTLFIYRRPGQFTLAPVECPSWARRPDVRVTVDEEADLQVVRTVVDGLDLDWESLSGERVIEFMDSHPEVAQRNAAVAHRNVAWRPASAGGTAWWSPERRWTVEAGLVRDIESHDLESLRAWSNDQQSILRQQSHISAEDHRRWYESVILPSRLSTEPRSIFVVTERDGITTSFGGLSDIEWNSRRAEMSFVAEPKIALDPHAFAFEFRSFLDWASRYSFTEIGLHRLFTQTLEFRAEQISLLEEFGFIREGLLRQHIERQGVVHDVVVHGLLASDLSKSRG